MTRTELSQNIYYSRFTDIIPPKQRVAANRIARDIFLSYIRKYANAGITEQNIVAWVKSDDNSGNRCYAVHPADPAPQHIHIVVEADNGASNIHKRHFSPPHIVAYHEVMHAEEYTKDFFQYKYGRETITTVKTIILLDEVMKKIKHIPVDNTFDYHKDIKIDGKYIPLGLFANFYRSLEKDHASLGDAILSEKSLAFLAGPKRSP